MSIRLVRIAAWGALVLGSVHCLATPMVLGLGFDSLSKPLIATFLYMFLGTGISLALAGVVLLRIIPYLREGHPMARELHKLGAVYLLFLGVGAVAAMADNPFAWMTLLDGLVAAVSLRGVSGDV